METGIHIEDTKLTKQSVDAVVSGIVKVLDAASKNNMDQATTQKALDLIKSLGSVSDIMVSGTSVVGDTIHEAPDALEWQRESVRCCAFWAPCSSACHSSWRQWRYLGLAVSAAFLAYMAVVLWQWEPERQRRAAR